MSNHRDFFMFGEPVAVSVLTNGSRRHYLERCINSFLTHCHYRPLVFCVFSNGSTDDTESWLETQGGQYAIEWRTKASEKDLGCARGTNNSIAIGSDFKYQIHLESDFEHLSESESGVDRMWLHRALELMESECDYLYLRRMRNDFEMRQHWWSQWMPKVTEERDEYLRCPGFWWSNNPTLFRVEALQNSKTLPLDVSKDGQKGSHGWSQPELQAPRPPMAWIHKWGMFIHERQPKEEFVLRGCHNYGPFGCSMCKYGFWKQGNDKWCGTCDHKKDFRDMNAHEKRCFE